MFKAGVNRNGEVRVIELDDSLYDHVVKFLWKLEGKEWREDEFPRIVDKTASPNPIMIDNTMSEGTNEGVIGDFNF